MKYVPVETRQKRVKYVQSSGVFIIGFEHISYLFSSVSIVHYEQTNVCQELLFLCKFYYPEFKDEQILYLTLFKIAPDFLNH